jgi:integrase
VSAPARLVRQERRLPESLDVEDVSVFLADLGTHRDRAMMLLMLLGGLRSAEVRSLRLADVDMGLRQVTARPSTAQMRIKAIRVLADWLAAEHPEITRPDQLDRSHHIEPFLPWSRRRPWRGANGNGKTVGMTVFHHHLVDLRVFFEDIAEWAWSSASERRVFFLSDLPRLSEPMPPRSRPRH